MISISHVNILLKNWENWDVLLSVFLIIGGYLIFCPRFLGQYFFKKHGKCFELAELGPNVQSQEQEESPVSRGDLDSYDLKAIPEDSCVSQADASEDEAMIPHAFETDDFMSLWRSSPSGLDKAVEAQLDEGFANMVGEQVDDHLDDDFWAAPPPISTDPSADNQAFDSALADDDAQLAGAALAVGAQRCGALWVCEGIQRLSAAGLPLSMLHAVELVQLFGGEARADLAADLWRQRHKEPAEVGGDPIPELELYTAVLEVCARCMDFEAAAKVAACVGWRSPSSLAGRRAMLALARWLARCQEFSQAWKCYQEVRRQGHSADLATHKALLAAAVMGADMSQAGIIFEDLIASGLHPDNVSFSTMIGGYCAAGALPEAMVCFERMRKYDIAPTTTLLDTVITGCLCCDDLAILEQVFVDMEADGVLLSSTTVESLVRYHGRGGNVDSALAIFEELARKHSSQLDSHAFGALISVCLAGSRLDLALVTIRRMVAEGLTPSAQCYESLVLGCMRQGNLSQAVLLVDDALRSTTAALVGEALVEQLVRGDRPTRHLEPELLEDLLRLIGRKRQLVRVGMPLLTRLQDAGVELSEQLTESLLRSAKVEASSSSSHEHPVLRHRRTEFQHWRNFI